MATAPAVLRLLFEEERVAEDPDLKSLLEEIEHCTSDALYKKLIDKTLNELILNHDTPKLHYNRNVLFRLFSKLSNRKNLRKYMYEQMNLKIIDEHIFLGWLIKSFITKIRIDVGNNVFRVKECYKMVEFASAVTQCFSETSKFYTFSSNVFWFYVAVFEVLMRQLYISFKYKGEEKSVLEFADCYSLLKLTLSEIAHYSKKYKLKDAETSSFRLATQCFVILEKNPVKFDIIFSCCLIIGEFSKTFPEAEKKFIVHKDAPILDFVDNLKNKNAIVLSEDEMPNIFTSDLMQTGLYLAIYYSLSSDILERQICRRPALEFISDKILDLASRATNFSQIVEICKAVESMAQYVPVVPDFEGFITKAVNFVLRYLDHYSDQVVNCAKNVFKVILKEAEDRSKEGEPHFFEILQKVKTLPPFSKVQLNFLLSISESVGSDNVLTVCPEILNHLLVLCTNSPNHVIASQIYINFVTNHLRKQKETETVLIWLRPLLSSLRHPNVKNHHVLENIIVTSFKAKPSVLRKLFTNANTGTECAIILQCVHHARMQGLTLPAEPNVDDYWRGLISKSKLELYMTHQNDEVRINALRVLAECQKTTERFTEWELSFLIKYLQFNGAPQNCAVRSKIVSYYKKVLTRFTTTLRTLTKKFLSLEKAVKKNKSKLIELNEYSHRVCYYGDFFKQFLQILIVNIGPDANHPRRSISLELLLFIHPITGEAFWAKLFKTDEIDNLKHILHDSYETNKQMAVKLLQTLPAPSVGFTCKEATAAYFEQSVEMARDVRPSRSQSGCYMFQLLLQSHYIESPANLKKCEVVLLMISVKIEDMLDAFQFNVVDASRTASFAGLLRSCLNLLKVRDVKQNSKMVAVVVLKLAVMCLTLTNEMLPIVGNRSPEGHLPDAHAHGDFDRSSAAQRVLVFAWKTLKEVFHLFAEIVRQSIISQNDNCELMGESILLDIGFVFMEIFINAKHRGVFEQAHVAFTGICSSFLESKNENLRKKPADWLSEGVALCTGQKKSDRLCSTRRSAGLPFMILSILPNAAKTDPDCIPTTINTLINAHDDPDDEIRMHSLNVLRFIFKSAELKDQTAPLVGEATMAALENFRSKSYCVRNSAHLLFSTTVNRIFGTPNKESVDQEEMKMSLSMFYTKYKDLLLYLLAVVEEEYREKEGNSMVLHPVLIILARLTPSQNEEIRDEVKRHIPHINKCISNSSIFTRDLAARASIFLIENFPKQLQENFRKIASQNVSNNECNGLLLQIYHILNSASATIETLEFSNFLSKSRQLLFSAGYSYDHMTIALYMDVVYMLLSKFRNFKDLEVLKDTINLLTCPMLSPGSGVCQTSYFYSRFQLITFVLLNKFEHVESTYVIVTSEIVRALYGDDLELKKRILSFLIYLNLQFSNDQFKEHPLLISGDVEITPQIKSLVHSLDFQCRKELITVTHSYLVPYFHAEITHFQENEYQPLVFLLLKFYPCFFQNMLKKGQISIDTLVDIAQTSNDEVASAVISCLSTFLTSGGVLTSGLVRTLMRFASPVSADVARLATAQFLVSTQSLFDKWDEFDRLNILNVVMVLLEDDEAIVRNTMSLFRAHANLEVVPDKARSTLLTSCVNEFRSEVMVSFLVSWALRSLPEATKDVSEVYEGGELNVFIENTPIIYCNCQILHNILWNLEDLSYENHTIFLEEQTLLVTTTVINSLVKVPSPMMKIDTKRALIRVLKNISAFIEDCTVGDYFCEKFSDFFNTNSLKFLKESLDVDDYWSMKTFLTYLYNPLLHVYDQFP